MSPLWVSYRSMTSGLSLILYLNSLVYHRNIFRSSSEVFGNLQKSSDMFGNFRKMFRNVRLVFRTILENLRKSSEGGRKSSENHQKRRHQRVYIIKKYCTAVWRYEFYFLVAKTIFYSLAALIRKNNIVLPLENKIHIFAPPSNILYIITSPEVT